MARVLDDADLQTADGAPPLGLPLPLGLPQEERITFQDQQVRVAKGPWTPLDKHAERHELQTYPKTNMLKPNQPWYTNGGTLARRQCASIALGTDPPHHSSMPPVNLTHIHIPLYSQLQSSIRLCDPAHGKSVGLHVRVRFRGLLRAHGNYYLAGRARWISEPRSPGKPLELTAHTLTPDNRS